MNNQIIICKGCGATGEPVMGRCQHCLSDAVEDYHTAAIPSMVELEVEIARLQRQIEADPMHTPLDVAARLAELRGLRQGQLIAA